MTTKNTQFTQHPALGGLDNSSDPTVLDPNFLILADNVEYREGGQRKKRPGFRTYSTNSTDPAANKPMVGSTASVRALIDFWRYGDSLVPNQHYVAVTGASIFASTGGGLWSPLTVSSSFGSDSNRQTNIVLAGDYAVISDGVSQPVAYDGLALTSTTLVTPSGVASTEPTLVAFTSTSAITVTTTNGYSVVTTVNAASSTATVTLTSTSPATLTSTSAITSPSTGTGAVFTSTSNIIMASASVITSTTPAMGSTSTTVLQSTSPVTVTITSTVQFQSLIGISALSSVAVTFTSTNPFSDWPIFTQATYHLNRVFYEGVSTAPSQVGFTAANNIFDSTGPDAGQFTINVGDGDQVMGLSKPFYGSLYIFKGPQKGSVFQLSGATPADFAIAQVGYGAPLLNPRALITTPTDVYWLSQYGVHSLQTTVKFGNVEQAYLSLPIQKMWRDRILKRIVLEDTHGFWHPQRNIVGWVVTPEGELSQHWLLCYNYALSDAKPGGKKFWSIWKLSGFASISAAVMLVGSIDPNHTGDPHLYIGGDTGLVYEGDQEGALNDAAAPYTMHIRTPTITRFQTPEGNIPETQEKGFVGIVTYFSPHGAVSADLNITVDRRVQSTTISLSGGGATLT